MAISSYGVQLMYYKATKSGTTTTYAWTKLIDIKSFPDLGGNPETLDTTTLSDASTTYILGIQQLDALTFDANYTSGDYTKVKALKNNETDFAVYLGSGKDGADGMYYFSGMLDVAIKGGGVNEVVGMTITIAPTTEIGTTDPHTSK